MTFSTLEQWLEWQAGLHPREIELGLGRVAAVWQRLRPEGVPCKIITVAGTNGKGSSVAILEAILLAAGYRTGAYTSPHLQRYNERIRLSGKEATDQRICRAFERIEQARGDILLTYFEFGTLAALDIFADEQLDVAILEVGLGGRLDAVNIVDPDVALITPLSIDHSDWLGDTLEQIGREKAGIMRPGRPVVCTMPAPPSSLLLRAQRLAAPLYLAGRDFRWQRQEGGWQWQHGSRLRSGLPLPFLRGSYQLQNAAGALMCLQLLQSALPVDQRAVRQGLQTATLNGRFQVMGGRPLMLFDVAHNPQAARVLADDLRQLFCQGRRRALFSMLGDKDVAAVVGLLAPLIDQWYLTPLAVERGLTTDELADELLAAGVAPAAIQCFHEPAAAFAQARADASDDDQLLIIGSFYLVGAVQALI